MKLKYTRMCRFTIILLEIARRHEFTDTRISKSKPHEALDRLGLKLLGNELIELGLNHASWSIEAEAKSAAVRGVYRLRSEYLGKRRLEDRLGSKLRSNSDLIQSRGLDDGSSREERRRLRDNGSRSHRNCLGKWLRGDGKSGHWLGKMITLGFKSRFSGRVLDGLQLTVFVDVTVLSLDVSVNVASLDPEASVRAFESVRERSVVVHLVDLL